MKRFAYPNATQWLLLAALFFVVGFCHYPEALSGKIVWDERFSEYIPWRVESARLIREGEFPAFTDRVFAGMPLFAQAYVGALYPPNWLYVFFGAGLSNWLAILHTVLGGLGMVAYLRGHRFTWIAATVGALFFVTMTFLINHADHISMREAALWAPWVAWGAVRSMKRRTPAGALCFAIPLLLQIATGYLQIVMMTGFWVAGEWFARARLSRAFVRSTVAFVAGGLLASCLAAPQLIAAKRMAPYTPRAEMTLEHWQQSSFPPSHGLIFAQPRALGVPGSEWIGEEYPAEILTVLMPAGFALALMGLLLALVRWRRNPRRRWFVALSAVAFLSLLLAFGKYFAPNALLFHVPPFNYFRISDRWLFLLCTILAAFSAAGTEELLRLRTWMRPASLLIAWFGASCVLVIGGRLLNPPILTDQRLFELLVLSEGAWVHLLGIAFCAGALALMRAFPLPAVALVALTVTFESTHYTRAAHDIPMNLDFVMKQEEHPLLRDFPVEEIERLYAMYPGEKNLRRGELIPHNTTLFMGIPALSGYTPLLNNNIPLFLGLDQHGISWFDHETFPQPATLRKSAVSHVIFFKDDLTPEQAALWPQLDGLYYRTVGEAEGIVLAELLGRAGRFHPADNWHHAGSVNEVGAILRHPGMPIDDHSVALHDAPALELPPDLTRLPKAHVEVIELRGAMQRLRIDAPGDGVLVIRDVWWPGWRYRYENGREGGGSVTRADGAFRAVPLPAGEYDLVMTYRTPGVRLGVLLALLGVMGFAAWALIPWCAGRWRSR